MKDLVKAFLEKLNDPNLSKDYTIDDFYEEMGIPKKQRSDFATAALLKQMLEQETINNFGGQNDGESKSK